MHCFEIMERNLAIANSEESPILGYWEDTMLPHCQ